MMCRIEFLAPKNKNHNNQPLIRVGKPIGRVAAWRSWPSSLGIAAKLGPLLSLAFLRVRRRGSLKMSDSPIGKVGNVRELYDFLSVVHVVCYRADTISEKMAAENVAEREERLVACLNILRRTPIGDAEENIAGLASLLASAVDADAAEELYQRSDPPLGHAIDPSASAEAAEGGEGGSPTKKAFIISDYNRDGDSYRSPWSNFYYPPIATATTAGGESGGFQPSPALRQAEIMANEVFDSYRSLYYGSGDSSIASVYLWDRDGGNTVEGGGGFAGAFLIKKEIQEEDSDRHLRKGAWNSAHVVEVVPSPEGRTAAYGMTTTISLMVEPNAKAVAEGIGSDSSTNTCISGSLSKRSDRVLPISSTNDGAEHIANIGAMIEDVEIEMRSSMDSLHIQKTRYVVDSVRSPSAAGNGGKVATLLTEAVLARQANKS